MRLTGFWNNKRFGYIIDIITSGFSQNRRRFTETVGRPRPRPRTRTGAGTWSADARSPISCCPACSERSGRTCWKGSPKCTVSRTSGPVPGYRRCSTWRFPLRVRVRRRITYMYSNNNILRVRPPIYVCF